jgi:hypothetical protein
LIERLPPLAAEQMNEAQRAAVDALIAGPRGAVKGPFIALVRSPEFAGDGAERGAHAAGKRQRADAGAAAALIPNRAVTSCARCR